MLRAMLLTIAMMAQTDEAPRWGVEKIDGETAPAGTVVIAGVGAGAFDPKLWQERTLHWVPDARSPLIEPRQGPWRNIYAPSAVQIDRSAWRVFYGGWDGAPTGNDRIYSVDTRDFLAFDQRRTVIEHGPFQHVCNVNALRMDDGAFAMICTALVDEKRMNKPIFFTSPDGETWNGSPTPHTATHDDLISIDGYENFDGSDINGMNVILHEEGGYRLYFGDFKNFTHVFRASSRDGKNYTFDGPALKGSYAVNDVKKFIVDGQPWYLMGLHMNGPKLWYSLSRDGADFPEPRVLMERAGEADQYIVAIGWVVAGEQEQPGRRLLGVLYGAGGKPSLDANRIFARWLQKRIVFVTDDGQRIELDRALGPDRAIAELDRALRGRLMIFSEDGHTILAESPPISLVPGGAYRLTTR